MLSTRPSDSVSAFDEDMDIVIGTASDVKLLPAWIEATAAAPDAINRGKLSSPGLSNSNFDSGADVGLITNPVGNQSNGFHETDPRYLRGSKTSVTIVSSPMPAPAALGC
jgi:hypothetical protein